MFCYIALFFPTYLLKLHVKVVIERQCRESFGLNPLADEFASLKSVSLHGVLLHSPFLPSIRHHNKDKAG
jgi:hypothetical protein